MSIARRILAASAILGLTAACSPGGTTGPETTPTGTTSSAAGGQASETTEATAGETTEATADKTESDTLTVVTHDSFALPDELKAKFAEESGYDVKYVAPGDAGALVNQLILTKDAPLGDVVYGIDNAFAGRASDEGVLVDYESPALPATANQFDAENVTPIDFGDVCINADKVWFTEKGIPVPTTLDDLVKPEYKDLLVVTSPTSSSPGFAFLAATIGAKGDGWLDYWKQLKDNGLKVTSGWTEAYYTDFSGADGKGPRPLVLSYATSPSYTVADGESTTEALLGTCFRQVEYAGVIENQVGAEKFIDFLLSPEVQAAMPTEMYMYPVVSDTPLPEEWVKFAPLSPNPIAVENLAENRDEWIREWAEAIG